MFAPCPPRSTSASLFFMVESVFPAKICWLAPSDGDPSTASAPADGEFAFHAFHSFAPVFCAFVTDTTPHTHTHIHTPSDNIFINVTQCDVTARQAAAGMHGTSRCSILWKKLPKHTLRGFLPFLDGQDAGNFT